MIFKNLVCYWLLQICIHYQKEFNNVSKHPYSSPRHFRYPSILTLTLFTTSSLARSHRSYQRAESRINAITKGLYFEKNVKALCEDCESEANKYNNIVHKMNIFVRLARYYKKAFLKNAKRIAAKESKLAKLKRRSGDEDEIQRLETQIARSQTRNNARAKMALAHKRNYEKLNAKRKNAMYALNDMRIQ